MGGQVRRPIVRRPSRGRREATRASGEELRDRRREGRANVFAASVDRNELLRSRLREAADSLCGGSLTPLLTQLLEAEELSSQQLAELRELVERRSRDEEDES